MDINATTADRLTQLVVLEDLRPMKFTGSLLLYQEVNDIRSSRNRLWEACPPTSCYLCTKVSGNLEMHLEEKLCYVSVLRRQA